MRIVGQLQEYPNVFGQNVSAPIAVVCASCGRAAEVFDDTRHGYNQQVVPDPLLPSDEPRDSLRCGGCGSVGFEAYSRFEYSNAGDFFMPDMAEFRGREQDLFTWFSMAAVCLSCGRQAVLAEHECA
jgi:hypothetical protein